MNRSVASKCAMLAAAVALSATMPAARAEECEDIQAALSKHADVLMKMDAKGAALCAGMGQLLGVIQAGRIVAEQCLEGDELKTAVNGMNDMAKAMEDGIKEQCK